MRTDVVVIGAGQAGLAISYWLTENSVDHVVLERGNVAQSWTSERWDSLRLLTPNWLSRLPGYRYAGSDPDGYMAAREVSDYLRGYATTFGAPVVTGTSVDAVRRTPDGFVVTTADADWRCRAVVVATGAASDPRLPLVSGALPGRIHQLSPIHYRRPDALPAGGILVVGASASGAQLADELARHGRDVVLAVGDHVRVPRMYRGRDIHAWLDQAGILDEQVGPGTPTPPSLQLVGTPERRSVDLNALSGRGIQVVGRLTAVSGRRAEFCDDLPDTCTAADQRMHRLLDRIDAVAERAGMPRPDGVRPLPTRLPDPERSIDLRRIGTVIWATGFAPRYPWLDSRWLDRRGRIRQRGGVAAEPGLFAVGLPLLRRRNSTFIDGVGADAEDVAECVLAHLGALVSAA
jgi:putative flavoprotein involved in K+ transport